MMPSGVIEQHVRAGATRYLFMNEQLRHDLGHIRLRPETMLSNGCQPFPAKTVH